VCNQSHINVYFCQLCNCLSVMICQYRTDCISRNYIFSLYSKWRKKLRQTVVCKCVLDIIIFILLIFCSTLLIVLKLKYNTIWLSVDQFGQVNLLLLQSVGWCGIVLLCDVSFWLVYLEILFSVAVSCIMWIFLQKWVGPLGNRHRHFRCVWFCVCVISLCMLFVAITEQIFPNIVSTFT